jgi:DNA-binding NarL/FixJ family response regulator
MSIRVAIVEDQPIVRENLALLVNSAAGFSCVSAVPDAEKAIAALPAINPEVVLMDLHLPKKSGTECVRELKQALPKTQFIMLTIEEDSQRVFESLEAGATGYLVKNSAPEKILEAIQEVHQGGSPVSSHIARLLVRSFHKPATTLRVATSVTARESEILTLLAKGYRSKEVADELRISVPTVNTHVRNVYEKLQVRSRAEAVARFLQK